MTRRVRSASLLVAFYLLTSAATAYGGFNRGLGVICLPDTIDPRGPKTK